MNNVTRSVLPSLAQLSWPDYTIFSLMLGMSALIGVYFGFFKKQSTPEEYLLGGKQMKVYPIALSLIASLISGATLLAVPSDVYRFGWTYILHIVSISGAIFLSYYVYIPVFYKLQMTSTYEYLELRFNSHIRKLSSFINTISTILYLPVVIYAPALALSQATGIDVYLVSIIVSLTCVFYTTIGGFKAVVWTDALQCFLMLFAITGVLYLGIKDIGGFSEIFNISRDGGRLDLYYGLDPTNRDSVWAIIFGSQFLTVGIVGIGQGYIQKYLSLPTMSDVKKAVVWLAIGANLLSGMAVFIGLVIYSRYANCDPYQSKKISKHDQILPLYIMEITENAPGLCGLYLSGLISAALSSLSTSLNCISGTIYEDFVSKFMPSDISKKQISNVLKLIVVIIGILGTAMIFLIERMGTIMPIHFALLGMTSGPLLGIFTLGMTVPFANSKGALTGGVLSMLIMGTIAVKAQMYQMQGFEFYDPKSVSIENCEGLTNSTILLSSSSSANLEKEPFFLFRVLFYYYTIMGTLLVLLIGIPVSYFTRDPKAKKVDRDLITPIMHWALNTPSSGDVLEYSSIEKALHIVFGENEKDCDVQLKEMRDVQI